MLKMSMQETADVPLGCLVRVDVERLCLNEGKQQRQIRQHVCQRRTNITLL